MRRETTRLRVALTFDAEHPDRPTEPDVHDRIVETLARLDVATTFFLQGRWVEAYPERARLVRDAGHLVGNHSFYHARMPLLTPAGLDNDVSRARRTIEDVLDLDTRPWFRLPFGSGSSKPALLRRLEAQGYRHVHWDVAPREWRKHATVAEIEEETVAGVLARGDAAIVLMHSWPVPIATVLDGVVRRLRDHGATFVRLDELVDPRGAA